MGQKEAIHLAERNHNINRSMSLFSTSTARGLYFRVLSRLQQQRLHWVSRRLQWLASRQWATVCTLASWPYLNFLLFFFLQRRTTTEMKQQQLHSSSNLQVQHSPWRRKWAHSLSKKNNIFRFDFFFATTWCISSLLFNFNQKHLQTKNRFCEKKHFLCFLQFLFFS